MCCKRLFISAGQLVRVALYPPTLPLPFSPFIILTVELKEFKNKIILIQGLGLNSGGVGMVKFFAPLAKKLIITDLRNKQDLKPSLEEIAPLIEKYNIELVLGEHRLKDFEKADIVIRNPAVKPGNKYIEHANKHSAKIYMEISLFLSLFKGLSVGITGTRGKSTTTALIYEFLSSDKNLSLKHNFLLAGNIGKSAIIELEHTDLQTIAVLEISSFQAATMRENKQSVNVAVVTTIYPDHLNWHPNMQDYIQSKRAILEFQTPNDFAVLNLDQPEIREFVFATKGKVYGYTMDLPKLKQDLGTSWNKLKAKVEDIFYYKDKDFSLIFSLFAKKLIYKLPQDIKLKGVHNRQNILSATVVAKLPIFNVEERTLTKVLTTFSGLPGRQEYIATKQNIDFYNDTTATMDVAVKAAVKRFYQEYKNNVIFIMGGVDKGINYASLLKFMKGKVSAIVLFEGSASEKIKKGAQDFGIKTFGFYDSMQKAVEKAFSLAKQMQKTNNNKFAVVLSPAAASFNMFLNEWDRAKKFVEVVKGL